MRKIATLLLSLVAVVALTACGGGSDGKDGLNGKDGVNGTNGANGKDGKDGANGMDGTLFSGVVPDVLVTDVKGQIEFGQLQYLLASSSGGLEPLKLPDADLAVDDTAEPAEV